MTAVLRNKVQALEQRVKALEAEVERLRVHERELRVIVLNYSHEDCDEDFQVVVDRAATRLRAEDTLRDLETQEDQCQK